MKRLLEDGLAALCDLLQSGGGTCHPETENRLERLSRDWEDAGLHTGSKLLSETAALLAQRRHGGTQDPLALMDTVSQAARYTRLCYQKYSLDAAGERLKNTTQEEDHETDT